MVPGHYVRTLLTSSYVWMIANTVNRRNGAILLCCNRSYIFIILDCQCLLIPFHRSSSFIDLILAFTVSKSFTRLPTWAFSCRHQGFSFLMSPPLISVTPSVLHRYLQLISFPVILIAMMMSPNSSNSCVSGIIKHAAIKKTMDLPPSLFSNINIELPLA